MPSNNKQGISEKITENFTNRLAIGTSNKFADAISDFTLSAASSCTTSIPYLAFNVASSLAATTINCLTQSGTKRKTENDGPKEIEFGTRESSDDFHYMYNNDEITNKRLRLVDNYVPREEKEQELGKLFDTPKPATNCVERGEFEELSENFETKCSIQVVTSKVSIVGLGGIGKTQLAAKFVEKNEQEYKSNFWIDAEKYCITDSFKQLAKKIEVSPLIEGGGEKSAKRLANDVYAKLNNQKTLIVFDNVDDYDSVKDFLPHQDYNTIHVLITSRYNKWENTGVYPVELGVFTFEESKEFIKKELKIDDDDQIKKLHEKLQGLPLALQQAISYIKQQQNVDSKFGIEDYLKEYDKEAEKLLSYDLHEKNNDPYMKTVMTTWQVTLDKIEKDITCGKEAIRILNVMAYLTPDNILNLMFLNLYELGITPSEFKKQKEKIRNKVANAIDLLKRYSMINQGNKPDLSNIHRLVQEVIRIDLKNKGKEKEYLVDAIYCLQHGDQYDLRSFVFVTMYASQYKELDNSVLELSQRFCDNDIVREIGDFQNQSSSTQEKDRFLEVSKIILRSCFISNDYKMIEFLIENLKSYYLLREQLEEWKTELLGGMEGYYTSKKEMLYHLHKLGLGIKFDCVKNLTSYSSWQTMLEFYFECGVSFKKEDLSELLKEAKSTLSIRKDCEYVEDLKIQEQLSKGGDVEFRKGLKKRFKLQQESVKKLISLIEKKQSTLRDSEQEMDFVNDYFSHSNLETSNLDSGLDDKHPIIEHYTETLENDLNDAMEEGPRSTIHSSSVTHSGQVHSKRY